MIKKAATSRNPGDPKARQVSVPSKKAATIPENDKPVTKIGEPNRKIKRLASKEDSHVAGDD